MDVNEDSGWACCRWWAKALPSGPHERLTTFALTEDSNGVDGSGWWYSIPVGSPVTTLLDVTSVCTIKWTNLNMKTARLTLDALVANSC